MRRATLAALVVGCGYSPSPPAGIDGASSSSGDPTAESSSTSGETEDPSTTMAPDTDTEDPSTTTGPECSETVPCVDEAAPFCVDGECSPCSAVVDGTPDEACATLDETLPLCVDDACVQCTAESFEACGGTTPLCGDDNTCVGCRFHEECEDIGLHACNIATGACFSADAADVSEVDASTNGAVQAAVNTVANGAEHVIRLTGGGGLQTVTIDGGKTIAIVSDSSTVRTVSGNTASPIITVTGAGSTVYLHRLRIDGSNGVGISVGPAGTLYADSTQVSGNDGGGITLATGSNGFLRNCMVQGNATSSPAIMATGADLNVLYSSLGRTANFGDPVLSCSGGSVSVRNCLVVSETNTSGDEVDCSGASIETTAVRSTQMPATWFGGFASGDYSLTTDGQTEFANIATWEDGDPPFDFDGDDRPATDGAMDYPGADVP